MNNLVAAMDQVVEPYLVLFGGLAKFLDYLGPAFLNTRDRESRRHLVMGLERDF